MAFSGLWDRMLVIRRTYLHGVEAIELALILRGFRDFEKDKNEIRAKQSSSIWSVCIERCHLSLFDTTSKTKYSVYSNSIMGSMCMSPYMRMVTKSSTSTFTQRNLDEDLTIILISLFSLSFWNGVLRDMSS